jgi:hypothetical protein
MADIVGAEWVEPRGIEPLTSALPARERLLMEVRLCSWSGRRLAIGVGIAANLARRCM